MPVNTNVPMTRTLLKTELLLKNEDEYQEDKKDQKND